MTQKRTVLLLGRTGNGKSTLANVMSNTDKFKESELGASETRNIQEEWFNLKDDDITYHIIDTIGIGDTRLSEQQVLFKIAETVNSIRNGLNQILFVTSGRFTEEEVKAYTLLRTVFFNEDIGKYTTIVRTKFPTFRRAERCRADRENMIKESEDIADIIHSCKKLIHVNNLTEDEDPELKTRIECGEILRNHLKFNCEEVYHPRNLDDANERIRNHMTDREMIQKEIDIVKEKLEEADKRVKKGDEAAIKAQQEHKDSLNNLIKEQEKREKEVTNLMTQQMDSKLNEMRNSYEARIEELNRRKPEVHHHYHRDSGCRIM
ncbi:MAG: GTPase Der [Mycoplasmataceae bacterium]|nr:MAG: GTPase Der [Mycoplasmataceae bacterium]